MCVFFLSDCVGEAANAEAAEAVDAARAFYDTRQKFYTFAEPISICFKSLLAVDNCDVMTHITCAWFQEAVVVALDGASSAVDI